MYRLNTTKVIDHNQSIYSMNSVKILRKWGKIMTWPVILNVVFSPKYNINGFLHWFIQV